MADGAEIRGLGEVRADSRLSVAWTSALFPHAVILLSALAYSGLDLAYYLTHGHVHFMDVMGDSQLYEYIVRAYATWTTPFTGNAALPMQGMFNPAPAVNVWLNPGWLLYGQLDPVFGPAVSEGFFAWTYMAATYALARSIKVSRWGSVVLAQALALIALPPFTDVSRLYNWLQLVPANCLINGLAVCALSLFFWMERTTWKTLLIVTGAIAAIVAYAIIIDGMFASLLAVSFCPFFFAGLWWRSRRDFLFRCAVLALAGAILFASGLIHYLRALPLFEARIAFGNEMFTEPADASYASMLWGGWAAFHGPLYLLAGIGWLNALERGTGVVKRLGLGCIIHAVIVQGLSLAFVLTDINWVTLPLPIYIEVCAWPCYLVTAVAGWKILTSGQWIAGRRFKSIALYTPWLTLALILSPTVGWTFSAAPPATPLSKDAEAAKPIIDEFVDHLRLRPGMPFRGALSFIWDVPDDAPYDYRHFFWIYTVYADNFGPQMRFTGWWAEGVPTLDIYQAMITPQLYYLTSRLFSRPTDYQAKNWAKVVRPNPTLLQMLGVRYILADRLDLVPGEKPEMAVTSEMAGAGKRTLALFELPHPNLGNYSPTNQITADQAPQIVAAMAASSFDPQQQVVTDVKLPTDLVPVTTAEMTPIVDGIAVHATSAGQSVLVLPVQYSNCFALIGGNGAALFRANLAMTGVVFDRTLDGVLQYRFGVRSPGCRERDEADMHRLGVTSDGSIKPPPGLHPFALIHVGQ